MIKHKIKKLLIAMDSDPSDLKVVESGINMAKAIDAEVVLLYIIINLVTYSLTYLKIDPFNLNSVNDKMVTKHCLNEKSKMQSSENIVQTTVKQGDFASSLINSANEMAVDMIIMGSKSSKWLEEIIMGRITNEVLLQTKMPILIIPTKNPNESYTFISLEY